MTLYVIILYDFESISIKKKKTLILELHDTVTQFHTILFSNFTISYFLSHTGNSIIYMYLRMSLSKY